ncbi:MAG TPA: hypothetical protein DET40_09200 [Lentisphaeria bacterium]|nr:MAG: hypothetical protein A2X45_07990 [Lentisphaerae bacterium GWF2_50_93]HCE43713.1 hypothetical protein [Lentisphaeria bacterium]
MIKNDSCIGISRKNICRNAIAFFWPIIILLCLLSYSRGLNGDFVFDDGALIKNDQFYANEANPLKCWDRGFWSDGRGGLYRPLTVFSYWLNVKFFGLHSPLFRSFNLLLHILSVFLLYLLARKLSAGKTCAMIAAFLFAVHPLHSEAVIPAFGRAELLCAAFMMLALIFHVSRKNPKTSALLAGISFVLALWSKEHAVAFLPLCLMYDLLLGKLKDRKLIFRYCIYIAFFGLFIFSKFEAMHSIIPEKDMTEALVDNRLALSPAPERIVGAVRIQGLALAKFAWPAVLSHDYSYAQILPSRSVYDSRALITIIIFLGAPLLLLYLYPKRRMLIIFLVSAYAICIMPAGNFIVPAGTIFAERLTYIPSIWLCIFFSLAFIRLSSKIPFSMSILIIVSILGILSCRTAIRCHDWQDRMSLALAGVRASPQSIKTWGNLAVQFEEAKQFREAVAACDIAIGIYPEDSSIYLKRGTYHTRLQLYDAAEKDFLKSLSLNPDNLQAGVNLAIVLANTGRREASREILKGILKKNPSHPAAAKMLETMEKP